MKKKPQLPFSGGVAICRKQHDGKQFSVWVDKAPDLKARAKSLKAAEEALVKLLWERFNVDEPIAFQYLDEPENADAIFVLGLNETTESTDPGLYFEDGFCRLCQSGLGRRNAEVLQLSQLPKKAVSGLFTVFQPYSECGRCVSMNLLHSSLCNMISKTASSAFSFREVLVNGKSCLTYLEAIPQLVLPKVVPKSQKGTAGWKCPKCGTVRLNVKGGAASISQRDASSVRERQASAIGSLDRFRCIVTGSLFKQLHELSFGKGLLASPLQEFSAEQINTQPRLMTIDLPEG